MENGGKSRYLSTAYLFCTDTVISMDAKILIVDDSEDRHKLKSVLCCAGYRVIMASSWEDVFAKRIAEKPDVIFIDAIMTQQKCIPYPNVRNKFRKLIIEEGHRIIFIIPKKISKAMIKQRMGDMWFWELAFPGGFQKIQKPYVAEELINILNDFLEPDTGDANVLHKGIHIEYE